MQDSKLTVRAPKELILKLKSVLALKDISITDWLRQKMEEEVGKETV